MPGRGRATTVSKYVSIYATAASRAEAKRIAKDLLLERLVACANILPVESLYWWKGRIESARESALVMKTRKALATKAIARVKALHSYDLPCVVAWPIIEGGGAYLDWVDAETRKRRAAPRRRPRGSSRSR